MKKIESLQEKYKELCQACTLKDQQHLDLKAKQGVLEANEQESLVLRKNMEENLVKNDPSR